MRTRLLVADPSAIDSPATSAAIDAAAAVLRAGGLVAFPTETVYGLGGLALDPHAVLRIFEAKGRPHAHPLIAHVAGEAEARALAAAWPNDAARLARAFWPGPLTIVVPRALHVPSELAGGGDSIAVRAPAHPVALALLARVGAPVAAPSANRYQSLSPTDASHVVKSLGDRVDLVLDGGPCTAGIESTVVDVRGARPRVLRPGAIGIDALRTVVPDVEAAREDVAPAAVRPSPGMDPRHYAPRARLLVVNGRDDAIAAAARHRDAGARTALVVRGAPVSLAGVDVNALPDEPSAYAARLFATLHAIDDTDHAVVVVEAVPSDDAWWAIEDRLRRASTPASSG